MAGDDPATRDAGLPPRAEVGKLRRIVPFVWPYRWVVAGALVALTISAGAVLVIGLGLRALIDQGFTEGGGARLDDALRGLLVVIVVLAAGTYARFFCVSWIGEKVVADIRRAVFDHMLRFSPPSTRSPAQAR